MPGIQGSTVGHVPTVDQAAAALRRIQEKCGTKAAGLESLSKLLADPLFQQLLNLENALEKVKNEIRTNPTEFPDYTLDNNGRLIDLNPEQSESDSEDAALSPHSKMQRVSIYFTAVTLVHKEAKTCFCLYSPSFIYKF